MREVISQWWNALDRSQRKGAKLLLSVLAFLGVITLISPALGFILFAVLGGIAAFLAMIVGLMELFN